MTKAPDGPKTLIEMLAWRADEMPDRQAAMVCNRPLTFGQLWAGTNRFAALLQEQGIQPGDRVLIALPNGEEFFFAFYGSQRLRAIATPVFPGFNPARIQALAQLCGARVVVIPSDTPAATRATLQQTAGPDLTLMAVGDRLENQALAGRSPAESTFPEPQPNDVAFIQYTSGSTGNPKGVQLSHANLLTNMRQMIAGMAITAGDIFVSWLPVYHDMGLILKTMVPFYLAAELHLLPANLKDIHHWLATIQEHRATFTAAPDFAYRLCLRYIQEPEKYDLSSLRVALNAAEPVRAQTVVEFQATFGLTNVMVAGYGLAEATVGVSMWPPQTAVRISPEGHVSAGPPFPGIDIQILHGDKPAGVGEIGEIAIHSPANTRGYYDNPEATQQLFWQGAYIRSGDLGYLDSDGNVYIVGRQKNMIIQTGRNIYAEEVEEVVNQVPGVRYSAAVGVDRGGLEGEQLLVMAEIRDGEDLPIAARHEIGLNIVQACYERFGFRPGRVFLLRPKSIPLTHNGKLQHHELRELYIGGDLQQAVLYP